MGEIRERGGFTATCVYFISMARYNNMACSSFRWYNGRNFVHHRGLTTTETVIASDMSHMVVE
jgi:hypothetical protein